MINSSRLLVGFDQFISFEWADYALSLASANIGPEQASNEIKAYLTSRIKSAIIIRKTANVLCRLWFSPHADLEESRQEALNLYPNSSASDRLVLHWGMATAIFPVFRETCVQIGRLSKLQDSFKRIEVVQRVLEQFGNHGSLPRAINRIIQTMGEWNVVCQVAPQHYSPSANKIELKHDHLVWLLEIALLATPGQRTLIDDMARLPEIFPFDLNGNARRVTLTSSNLSAERDGTNLVYVLRK